MGKKNPRDLKVTINNKQWSKVQRSMSTWPMESSGVFPNISRSRFKGVSPRRVENGPVI